MRRVHLVAIACCCLPLLGCEAQMLAGDDSSEPMGGDAGPSGGGEGEEAGATGTASAGFALEQLEPEAAVTYLGRIAPIVVRRDLNVEELNRVESEGGAAIEPILEGWTADPGLAKMAREFISEKLSTSGQSGDLDFELPGHLAAHLAREQLPWQRIITADYCVDAAGDRIECDTGAPYSAGVLTTRAFMVSRVGRFNLTRASGLMGTFACREYPMESDLQPRFPKGKLIEMFRAETKDEQTDERASNGFGNGFGCYTCHGQFSAHAQIFVKFDEEGRWIADATGQQDPDGELGRSFDKLMTSHFDNPEEAASEQSMMFGETVAHLGEAAQVLAESDVFEPCAVRQLLIFTLGLDPAVELDADGVDGIVERLAELEEPPSYGDLIRTIFTDPWVVRSTVESLGS